MPPRIALAMVIHNHQPIGNFGWVIDQVYRAAYEPMLGALERHPAVRIGLHYSGPLLEWLRAEHPEALDRVRRLVERGQVEVLGGGYDEPVLVSLPERDRQGQLRLMADEVERTFGERPSGAWLAERVWEPCLPADLGRAGYGWTVVDDNHLRAATVPEDAMWGAYTTDDQGERLTVFGTEQGLRYRIPFRPVDELVAYLREHATEAGDRVGVMGDDGEKFGAWPGTFEHCWGRDGWVDRCFEAIEASGDWLSTVTPSSWLAGHRPVGRVYIPAASYEEMTGWALPADEAETFSRLVLEAREQADPSLRFLRGAMWRNFQARYREVNDLHKQMLRASAKVDAMPPGLARSRALRHLYRGQSNDCYWHGLFGGIYLVHMRMATLAELIAAEDLADRAAREASRCGSPDERGRTAAVEGGPDGGRLLDLDLDGVDEVLLADEGQVVTVDPAEGGGVSSWDLRASRVALGSVLRRRPEAYHRTLLEHERVTAGTASGGDGGDGEAPRTIHEIMRVKEPGLAARLHYDTHERRGGLVRLLPLGPHGGPMAGASAVELEAVRERELGDFVDGPFDLVALGGDGVTLRREGRLATEDGEIPLTVTKRIACGGGRLRPWLEMAVVVVADAPEGPTRPSGGAVELGLEWSFDLLGGGGNPAAYYAVSGGRGGTGRLPHDAPGDVAPGIGLAFGNDDEGVRVEVQAEPAARLTWYPVETVSNSEAGFERSYQGSCLLVRWPLRLDAGEQGLQVRFTVSQSRDRAEEGEP